MSDDVNIKISATDNATATLRHIQGELGKFSASLKSLAGLALGGSVVTALVELGKDSLRAYGESERAVTMLDRVLKSTGNTIKLTRKEIQDYANVRMSQTTFDDDAIVEAASHLARFRDLSSETFTETLNAAQDLATVMGTDLVSATQMLGRALSDPADGMAKLARAGVLFTDSQKEQIKMLDAIGDKAGQQKIILAELQRQFGGAAIGDASTAAGQIKKLHVEIENLKEAIGERLTPTVTALVDIIRRQMGNAPAAAGQADAALRGEGAGGGGIRGANAEHEALLAARKRASDERREIERRIGQQSNLDFLFSPIQNFNDIQRILANEERQAAINAAIKRLRARVAAESQTAILGTISGSIGNLALNAAGSIGSGVSNLFKPNSFLGLPMPSIAQTIANDLNAGGVMQLFDGLKSVFDAAKPFAGNGATNTPPLGATESRFLTRGRGQMSPAEQKQLEGDAKQLAELKAIRDAIAGLGQNMLVVEGIS